MVLELELELELEAEDQTPQLEDEEAAEVVLLVLLEVVLADG